MTNANDTKKPLTVAEAREAYCDARGNYVTERAACAAVNRGSDTITADAFVAMTEALDTLIAAAKREAFEEAALSFASKHSGLCKCDTCKAWRLALRRIRALAAKVAS